MNYALHLSVFLSIYGIVALSLNLITGYCGLLTMAHASYFAVGCYTYALLTAKCGWEFLPAAGMAFALACSMSLFISLPAWRFKGDSFVLITLAVQQMLFSLIQNWASPSAEPGTWANLTNGTFGLSSIPKPTIFGFIFSDLRAMALLALIVFFLCMLVFKIFCASPWARLLKAMRDDELAARGLGKNVRLAKIQAVGISCGLAAVAGTIYASYVNYIDPGVASLDESMLVLCMVLVGGIGNFKGPLVGAFMLIAIPEILRCMSMPDAIASNMRLIFYSCLLIGLMHFRPQGLAGVYRVS